MIMTNKEKYNTAFMETFAIQKEKLTNLEYMSIPDWDSVGHMSLISELEDSFEITMDTDDIIDFISYEKGLEILKEIYKIEF